MGNFFSTACPTPETQQEPLLQTQTEASFSSPTDIHPPALTHFDTQLNIPPEDNIIQLYSLANLPLENNFLNPIFYGFLGQEDLEALAEDNGHEQTEFFVVTSEHPDFSDIFIASNQVRAVLLPIFDEKLNRLRRQEGRASIVDELQAGINWFNIEFNMGGSLIFKFELWRMDDGTISDSMMDQIVSEELMQPEYFDNFEDRMRREGNIRFFVCTRDQLRNPLVVIFLQIICISDEILPVYLCHAQTPGMSDEEAVDILGSPTSWIEGLEEAEIDCAICLDTVQRGDEVKTLAYKHVYHYACILCSTEESSSVPCAVPVTIRTGQSE
ncbi:hypothetical protein SUGI_0216620 [Cryptomeria japonica]|nr:hypothetical protein SUGI_0216620 [Cryptomeria japonica]